LQLSLSDHPSEQTGNVEPTDVAKARDLFEGTAKLISELLPVDKTLQAHDAETVTAVADLMFARPASRKGAIWRRVTVAVEHLTDTTDH
jgi:hypothetical protein